MVRKENNIVRGQMARATVVKLYRAKHGTRLFRRDGTAERFVALWDSKQYNQARFVGFVDPKTMDACVMLGHWQNDGPVFRDGSDTAHEHWWKVEE